MTPLSPLDALGPAFRRTREVLATPFRPGTFVKIALVAALTQTSFYSTMFSYPLQGAQFALLSGRSHRWATIGSPASEAFLGPPQLAAYGLAALLIVGGLGLLLWVFAAYLYCRLRFTLFDLVIYKRGRVRQAWGAYGRQAWRYFGLVVLAALAFLVVASVVAGPMALNLVRTLAVAGANANPLPFIGAALPFILAIFAVAMLWAVTDALMEDFLLPPMAIEDAPIESALARFVALLKQSFGSVTAYVLLRFAVGIGLTWILMLAFFAALFVGGLVLFGIGTLLYHALWASVAGQVICVALAIMVGFIVLIVYAAGIVAIYGTAAVFKQSYALYFFGGRYAELGNRLEPPAASQAREPIEVETVAVIDPMSFPPVSGAPPVW